MSALSNNLAAIEALLPAAQEDLDSANGKLADALQALASDNDIITTLNQRVTSLQSQLAAALANGKLSSAFLAEFHNLQTLPGWIVAGGTAGNTGQTGSKGTGTFTQNPDGTMTLAIQPAGPYYDAFCYRKMSAPTSVKRIAYRASFMLDAANLPLCQAVELDGSFYDGHFRFQPAGQVEMHGKTLRYYNPLIVQPDGTTKADWVSTGVAVNVQAGQWIDVELLCEVDRAAGTLTYISAAVNGKIYPLNILVKCKPNTSAPFIESSVQGDSNSHGAAYQLTIDQVGMAWL